MHKKGYLVFIGKLYMPMGKEMGGKASARPCRTILRLGGNENMVFEGGIWVRWVNVSENKGAPEKILSRMFRLSLR